MATGAHSRTLRTPVAPVRPSSDRPSRESSLTTRRVAALENVHQLVEPPTPTCRRPAAAACRARPSRFHRRTGDGGLTDYPRSRDRDRRHAAQRIAAIGGAGPARLPRRLAGRRARRAVRPKPSACRSSRLARAGAPSRTRAGPRPRAWPSDTLTGGRARSTPGSTSRPTTASASPGRSPRPPSSGTGSALPPPAAVAAVAWQPHRPPSGPVAVVCVRLDAGVPCRRFRTGLEASSAAALRAAASLGRRRERP